MFCTLSFQTVRAEQVSTCLVSNSKTSVNGYKTLWLMGLLTKDHEFNSVCPSVRSSVLFYYPWFDYLKIGLNISLRNQ